MTICETLDDLRRIFDDYGRRDTVVDRPVVEPVKVIEPPAPKIVPVDSFPLAQPRLGVFPYSCPPVRPCGQRSWVINLVNGAKVPGDLVIPANPNRRALSAVARGSNVIICPIQSLALLTHGWQISSAQDGAKILTEDEWGPVIQAAWFACDNFPDGVFGFYEEIYLT